MRSQLFFALVSLPAFATLLASCALSPPTETPIADGARAELAILETTDLHTNIRSFDYFRLAEDKSIGFERVATLIKRARVEFPNTLLFDNGDTIQGTALADFQAQVKPINCDETLAMYRVMNDMEYDAAGIGNHEFNYGLSFLARATGSRFNVDLKPGEPPMPEKACAGPKFPLVLANVLSIKDRKPLFKPYVVLDRTL